MNWRYIICQFLGHEDVVRFYEAHCGFCGQRSPEWVQAQTPYRRAERVIADGGRTMMEAFERAAPVFHSAAKELAGVVEAFQRWSFETVPPPTWHMVVYQDGSVRQVPFWGSASPWTSPQGNAEHPLEMKGWQDE